MKHLPTIAASLIALALNAQAAEVYDREYQAVQAAGAALKILAPGCTDYRVQGVIKGWTVGSTLTTYNGAKVLTVQGPSYRVACTAYAPVAPTQQPPVPTAKKVAFTWTDQTARANGTPLADSEILMVRLYLLEGDKETLLAEIANQPGPTGTYALEGVQPGTYRYGFRAVDTKGWPSSLSSITTVTVQ
jgi:hypothetical protein